ncbi:Gfo/Idh/MocA family oxidoreductase [Kribbella qitaiheensis]|uniref:Gfo/Idh/MocA family oxidoreductase n=1 Tax=Kribbella qitaiheensis TaxID=1544730 RepID=A0A7G6X5R6_9ACTN|nr:Gfo/Idh/MocA family oxidoreductase [Kribbella qitaiheensis]QNE21581.1 Gfo/Idh/MocA family oxidoreductase [Kribbella qitaiheensis]
MSTDPIRLGIVGLGAMGRRVLEVGLGHPEYAVTHAADLDPSVVSRLRAEHPGVRFSTTPADVIHADVDAVYVATPPATHAGLVVAALEGGKAVFCEKPLAISAADAEAMTVASAGRPTAVNFALSDRLATRYVEQALADGRVGDVLGVEIRLHFPVWPRPFQADATWVAGRAQGGFVREVLSHFAYLTDRLLGPLEPVHVQLGFGGAGESTAYGLLRAGDVPVQLIGSAGSPGPTTYEWILRGTNQSYLLRDWRDLFVADSNEWVPVELSGTEGSEDNRLSLFAHLIHGAPSPHLADFASGRRVQRVVEAFHATE